MGVFSPQGITDAGKMLLATVQSGAAVFDATKLVMGSGNMPQGATVESMTAVISPIKELEIVKKKRSNDGKVIFGGIYSNTDITTAFYFREFAVYARAMYVADDGSTTYGDEVLYSYGNAGNTADLMSAYSTTTAIEKELDVIVWVGNEATVNLEIQSGVNITRIEVEEIILSHDIDENAHADLFAQTMPYKGTATDLNTIIKSGVFGWYDFISETLHTPAYEGITDALEGVVLNIPDNGVGYAQQHAFLKGAVAPLYRYMNGTNVISKWANPFYGKDNKPTPADIGTIPIIDAKTTAHDMDAIIKGGVHLALYHTNTLTLGTPYKYGKTLFSAATIYSYAIDTQYGFQLAMIAGERMFFRALDKGVIGEWLSNATSKSHSVSITNTGWTEDTANGGYKKTVSVTGILATDSPVVDVVLGTDIAANALYLEAWAKVTRITTAANSITLWANEAAPSVAFTIQLKVVR